MMFKSYKENIFTKNEAIDLKVPLSTTYANLEKKWRGYKNQLSIAERFTGAFRRMLDKLKT